MPAKKKKPLDACAKKVKARYKVWPSAYASGAVAKCRKVGVENWGESSTKRKRPVKKKLESGGIIAFGCGSVEEGRRKETKLY